MDAADVDADLVNILFTEEDITKKLDELARRIEQDYAGEDLLIVGVLRGAVMVMADLARAFNRHVEMDWMAVSSYGSGTKSSGVVRILKDLDINIEGRHVLVVEDILDTGLTLTYLTKVLLAHQPKALRVATLLDKPSRRKQPMEANYVGFRIPDEFVVGYGLDYAERYRNLPDICVLPRQA